MKTRHIRPTLYVFTVFACGACTDLTQSTRQIDYVRDRLTEVDRNTLSANSQSAAAVDMAQVAIERAHDAREIAEKAQILSAETRLKLGCAKDTPPAEMPPASANALPPCTGLH